MISEEEKKKRRLEMAALWTKGHVTDADLAHKIARLSCECGQAWLHMDYCPDPVVYSTVKLALRIRRKIDKRKSR